MIRTLNASSRTAVGLLFGLLLVMQGLMPAGYMPASADSGWLVMLCPEGLPRAFLAPSAHHDHSLHSAPGHHSGGLHAQHGDGAPDSYCPLGHAVGTPAIAELGAMATTAPVLAGFYEAREPELVLSAPRRATQPRAPPRS